MKPIRYETDTERVVTNCVSYMREWFNIPAPEWVYSYLDGTEKIHLLTEDDPNQLKISIDGKSETTIAESSAIDLAHFALATTIMVNKLQGIVNPSEGYVAAIGFRSAVIATTNSSMQRVA